MDGGLCSMHLVFEINDCVLYDTTTLPPKVLLQGTLAVYELRSQDLVVLKLSNWQYSLSRDIPVMAQSQRGRKMYALPKMEGSFGLLLGSRTSSEQESILESMFHSHSQFIIPNPSGNAAENDSNSSNGSNTTSKKIQGFLSKGGDFLRSGLISGAGFLASGIQSGGQYIKQKFVKPSPKEVKPETLAKVKMAKATSSAILTFTQAQISALISGAKVIGKEISSQVGNSSTGQKISSHKNYEDVKNVAKGTVHAMAAVYDGMFEGLCAIGRGVQGATTTVIQHKYGDNAGELCSDSFDTVGNVGNLTQAYKIEAIKAMHDGTQNQNLK